jgi:hypothetical protein
VDVNKKLLGSFLAHNFFKSPCARPLPGFFYGSAGGKSKKKVQLPAPGKIMLIA